MNIIEFSLYTLFGAGIYNAFLILLGYFAGTNENYFISHVGIISALIAIIFLVGIGVYLKLKNKK